MSRIKSHTIKAILTSQYWLIVSLSGVLFFFFALNRGGVEICIQVTGLFLIINVLLGKYPIKKLRSYHLITAFICAYLLVASVLVSPEHSHTKWMVNLVKMLGIVFSIHCLGQKEIDDRIPLLFCALTVLSVCWQFAARHLYNMPFGTFTNPHYLASFALLALPIIIYFFYVTKGLYRLIFVPIAIIDAELLLRTGSRTAFFGITLAVLFLILFLTKGRRKWIGMALLSLGFGALYLTEYADAAHGIEELIANLAGEERVQFWTQAWNKLKENSVLAWTFGNGIGYFPVVYVGDSKIFRFVFPHCHFLEILYLNGLVGVVLVFSGFTFLFFSLIRKIRQANDKRMRALMKCMLVVFLSWLIHSGLTLPFYSKYSLYIFAFILGTMFLMLEKKDLDETL